MSPRALVSFAVVKELFPEQTPAIMATMRESRDRGQKLVILDYMGFSAFVHYARSEESLVEDLEAYASAMDGGIWIDPRAFLVERFLKLPAAAALRDPPSA